MVKAVKTLQYSLLTNDNNNNNNDNIAYNNKWQILFLNITNYVKENILRLF